MVVDGYLCTSEFVTGEGKCDFDRSQVVAIRPEETDKQEPKEKINEEKATSKDIKSTEDAPPQGAKAECPVCRYMKAGPCGDQFIEWDKCIDTLKEGDDMSVCAPATLTMMNCMRQHEYYDVMSAGTHEKYLALQEQQQLQQQQHENQKQQEPK
jgi:hypothetical protein